MDPNRPPKNVEPGVPADKPPAYDVAMGVPASAGQPVQVDAYGRPIVNAVPAPPGQMHAHTQVVPNNANIRRDAQGNALCNKCAAPYPLPAGCTSWR
ncbi:hypothetical protein BBJ28_00010094 [Nothophytophthora sp. Chile5]|nr:hypothetical protein BBJ28_00010094 [Nothophytophthora sp. Chile5]